MRLHRLLAVFVLAVLAGCNASSGPTHSADSATSTPLASPTEPIASPETSLPVEPTEEPTPTPSPTPTVEPSDAAPSGSVGPGAAAACTGLDRNRTFFELAASDLDFAVYCAVLPSGWFVGSGEYRQAGGGRLDIAYRGPGGARLELHEGAFCAAADGCVPVGTESGDAQFGDKTGTLIAADDGSWAVVVDRGEPISWLAAGSGLEESAFRDMAGAFSLVSD